MVRLASTELGGYALHSRWRQSSTAAFDHARPRRRVRPPTGDPPQLGGFATRAGMHAGSVEVTPNGPVGVAMMVAEALLAVAKPARDQSRPVRIAELLRDAPVTCEARADRTGAVLGQTWELYRIVTN